MPDTTLPGATPEEPRTKEAKLEEEMAEGMSFIAIIIIIFSGLFLL